MTIAIPNFTLSYASHGTGGGGGCGGDCVPPTLGLDNQGTTRVEKGLTINSESFNVESYSQTIQTQIFKIGQNNTIALKIYENTSPDFLSHVELHFDVNEKVMEGITVEKSTTSIVWDDTGNDEIYGIYGEEIFKNIRIDQKIDDNLILVVFEFEAVKVLDESTLMIKIWDEKRNVSKNYFYNAIKIIDEINEKQIPDNETTINKDKIPTWIKNTAGWWAEGTIQDKDFMEGMQFLINQKIIQT